MGIFKYFPDRRCRTLIQPADDYQLSNLSEESFETLRYEFKQAFARLQDDIYRLTSALGPKRVGKDMAFLTARGMPSFLTHLCDTLNNDQKLEMTASWDRVAESSCCNSIENLASEYREALGLLKTKFPVSDEILRQELEALVDHMRERYKDEALGDEVMRNQYSVCSDFSVTGTS